ncbi:hypothetical protein CPB84DRAFT_300216 [Gymnopilus junonius]|uniref:RecQ-mediated genome instability protein 1 n=1 Tax=Gymnopilus junonius TaxID=109634 RepID=A0A9P5NUQ8_GYMJU|nr:hypothetical protein CPB84DRAFT_300216 [Gymnopilus junonius]
MPPSEQVVQWLHENYPKPRVDSEWLEGCVQWLEDDQKLSPVNNFPEFIKQVEVQLIESDLVDSMQHGTGLDPNISRFTGNLLGPPVMVQIMAITEVGTSAFNLEQIRVAREERMLAGEGNIEGDEEGDVEVEGEGPMPKYPRGHLQFQLSDGATTFEAFEYRPIPEFALGTTQIGFKLHLKGTRFHNGMAMLEKSTIGFLGGKVADLEVQQLDNFKRGLHVRLGRPLSAKTQNAEPPASPNPAPAATVRSPLRDICPPPMPMFPQHEDDVEMEPRRRLPANSSLNDAPVASSSKEKKQDRPIIGLPSRHPRTSTGSVSEQSDEAKGKNTKNVPAAERATLVYAGSHSKSTTSPYFGNRATASWSKSPKSQNLDFNFEPTSGQARRTLPATSTERPAEQSFDFDFLDEMDQENHAPQIDKGKRRADDEDGSSDYGMNDSNDFADPSFLEDLDKVEKAALSSGGSIPSSHFSSDPSHGAAISLLAKSSPSSAQVPPSEIIEIGDSDDEMLGNDDKENKPVAARHVRRRTEDNENPFLTNSNSRPSTPSSQSRLPMSQKTGKPVILAKKPSDIIDLSDSD